MGYMMGSAGSAAGAWTLIVIVAAIVALIVVGRLGLFGGRRHSDKAQAHESGEAQAHETDTDTPGEILRRRYAAGEIDEDEYLRRLSGLSQR